MAKVVEAAENRKDIEEILEWFTEDSVCLVRGGKYEGIESIREWLERGYRVLISSKHVPLRVEVSSSGDMAWIMGYATVKSERDEGIVEIREDYLQTLRKVEDIWKTVALCVT
jgi:ketosteroid isomerase-like protein